MGPLKYFDSIIPYCPHHPTSEHPSFFITIIMGMNSSRLMAVAAILAALTSIEVEACLGEPCKIGNPTMCRLIRETNRAGSMPAHCSIGESMPDTHRRLARSERRRLYNDVYFSNKACTQLYKKCGGGIIPNTDPVEFYDVRFPKVSPNSSFVKKW